MCHDSRMPARTIRALPPPSPVKKHKETHWGEPYAAISPQSLTSFEETVRSLKLTPREYKNSPALKEWVYRNKNAKYVPPDLLSDFGFEVSEE